MNRRRSVPAAASLAAVACAAAVALAGCGLLGSGSGSGSGSGRGAAAATRPPTESADGAAVSGLGSAADAGDLPDPCTLLTERDVTDLTSRTVTQIDEDDAEPGESTRFCQWQQDGGQLALFLSRTTAADFATRRAEGEPVDGVGEDAFVADHHLYVRHGDMQIDVYAHGGSEAENLEDAEEVAEAVIASL